MTKEQLLDKVMEAVNDAFKGADDETRLAAISIRNTVTISAAGEDDSLQEITGDLYSWSEKALRSRDLMSEGGEDAATA